MSKDLMEIRRLIAERKPSETLRQHVIDLLDGITAGTRTFRALYHPLGFVYVPLLRTRDWTLRLHIWDAEKSPIQAPYHCHTWDLSSYVLQGDLENQVVCAEPNTASPTLRVYRVVGRGDIDFFKWTDSTVHAELGSREQVFEEQIYRMASGIYHTTLNRAGRGLTTVALAERIPGTEELSLIHI